MANAGIDHHDHTVVHAQMPAPTSSTSQSATSSPARRFVRVCNARSVPPSISGWNHSALARPCDSASCALVPVRL